MYFEWKSSTGHHDHKHDTFETGEAEMIRKPETYDSELYQSLCCPHYPLHHLLYPIKQRTIDRMSVCHQMIEKVMYLCLLG